MFGSFKLEGEMSNIVEKLVHDPKVCVLGDCIKQNFTSLKHSRFIIYVTPVLFCLILGVMELFEWNVSTTQCTFVIQDISELYTTNNLGFSGSIRSIASV